MSGRKFIMRAEIADIKRDLLSIDKLEDRGYAVLFCQDQSKIMAILGEEEWHTRIFRRTHLYQVDGEIIAMRKIPSTGNTNEIMPVGVEEGVVSGGASGSGHQSYDIPVSAPTAVTTLKSAIREVPEHHIPDLEAQRRHVLQGHLGHAPWCDVCVCRLEREMIHTNGDPLLNEESEQRIIDLLSITCRWWILSSDQ